MSQHDLNIANQTASATRSDINNALVALGSTNSGSSAPTTTYANMMWYDTTANILKIRSEADDAWISIGYLDQSANAFRVFDDTQVTNTSGTQTGLIGDQTTGTWEAGTGTTESLVSPAKVKASIIANNVSYTQPTAAGAIGTYVTALYGANIGFGSSVAGSSLLVASTANSVVQSTGGESFSGGAAGSLSGTWRAMMQGTAVSNRFPTGTFLRIS
tara:strand:+ start:206 stop:853 length:648 start_codon:yes stop_codon:yes gene_type:complete